MTINLTRMGTVLAIIFGWAVFSANAANIVWVHQMRGQDGEGTGVIPAAGGGDLAWEDDQWRVLLEGAGHTILAHDMFDDVDNSPSDLDVLNSADLVIFSRDSNSGDYTSSDDERIAWTEGVIKPMMVLTPFVLRSNRWLMVDSEGIIDTDKTTGIDPLLALDPAHPIFTGALDASNQATIWDETVLGPDDSIDFLDAIVEQRMVGNGTVLAMEPSNDVPWIIYWETGVEFYDGSPSIAGGPRLYYTVGSDDDFYSWGEKNTTAVGDKILLNAINWMTGVGAPVVLKAGDADQDLDFDQLDLVKVQIAAKYLTGQVATWGEGDWNGAPGGQPGSPPAGNARFDQLDIIAALAPGHYLTGPYAAISAGGRPGDAQTSVGYNPTTGEVFVDAPAGTNLTSINMDSAGGIFRGAPAQNLGGSFDNDSDTNIFKATFGSSFGSLSFGNVAQTGLSQQAVLADLTVVGSLAGGGGLGSVDLIYVPEPATVLLLAVGFIGLVAWGRR